MVKEDVNFLIFKRHFLFFLKETKDLFLKTVPLNDDW